MRAQIISAIQEKGGTGKSTLVQCTAHAMAQDGAKVLLIDTDRQASCIDWAEKTDHPNINYVAVQDEQALVPTIERHSVGADVVLIDTAGFDSRMAAHAIAQSNLILIPAGSAETNLKGALNTFKHIKQVTEPYKNPPEIRVVLWRLRIPSAVANMAREVVHGMEIPVLKAVVTNLVGFESMSYSGGPPGSAAASSFSKMIAALQMENLIDYYNIEQGGRYAAA